MQKNWGWRAAVLGVASVLGVGLTLAAAPASATDDLNDYQGEAKKGVVVTSNRTYENNQTTFTFTLALKDGEDQVSHVLLIACPDIQIVSTSGPNKDGQITSGPTTASNDGSINHTGIKFDPGYKGVYTIVFAGNIAAADFVVKDGNGHKHYPSGANVCQTVTTPPANPPTNEPPANNPPSNEPPTNNPPANNPPTNNPPTNNPPTNNPPSNPASNQPSQPGTEVLAETATNNPPAALSTEVQGAQQSQPEAQATLPRTGTDAGLLASIGVLLAAFGSVARTACRRA